jgi:hypothetical protein
VGRWSEELTETERSNFNKWKQKQSLKKQVTPADMLAEFGRYYGWGGVQAAIRGELTAAAFLDLLMAGRYEDSKHSAILLNDMRMAVNLGMAGSKGAAETEKIIKKRLER